MTDTDRMHDFSDPATLAYPHDLLATIRASQPVCPVRIAGGAVVHMVTSADLVDEVTKRTEDFSSKFAHLLVSGDSTNPEVNHILSVEPAPVGLLLTSDDPEHKRYRALVNKVFAQGRVANLAPTIEKIVDDLIDDMVAKGEADFVNDFAVLLPTYVIADILGLERKDWSLVRRWSDSVIRIVSRMGTTEEEVAAAHDVVAFQRFIREAIADRRKQPRDDLISNLVNVRMDGLEPLTDWEAAGLTFEISVAGNETTRNTLMSGLVQLIHHPEQMAALRNDPTLIANAVEELLRYETPASSMWRVAAHDTQLGGVAIPAGTELLLRYDAVNRDPARFPDPDAFDIRRPNARNHAAFGAPGVHRCLGQMLARKELIIAFPKLLNRLQNIRILEGSDTSYWPGLLHRGIGGLRIGFDGLPRAD